MKNTPENKEKAIQYLYGSLEKAELEDFEEKLFTDESLSVFVSDIETDLIDEYVRGELEFKQKREFEKQYLTTDSRHERVALARTLQDELFETEKLETISSDEKIGAWASLTGFFKAPNLALAGGLGALLLLVLLGGIWIANQPSGIDDLAGGGNENNQENIAPINDNSPEEVSPTPEETPSEEAETNVNNPKENNNSVNLNKEQLANPRNSNTNKPKVKPTPKPAKKKPKTIVRKPSVFVASLFPPLRSSQNPVLKIPAAAKTIRLQLFDNFGKKYEKFIVELNNSTGTTIWSKELKAVKKRPQKSIGISLSENILKRGTYEIGVKGITKDGNVEDINYYNFVVQKVADQKE